MLCHLFHCFLLVNPKNNIRLICTVWPLEKMKSSADFGIQLVMNKQTKTNGAVFKIKQLHYFHLFLAVLSIMLCFAACRTKHKNFSNARRLKGLKLESIYVYDNGKDTIIKNYEMYQELVDAGILDTNVTKVKFGNMPGSTHLEFLIFHSTKLGESTFSGNRNFTYDEIEKDLKSIRLQKNYDSYINSFTISKDSVLTFIEGEANPPTSTKYTGKIYKDSIIMHLNPTLLRLSDVFSQGDSIRVYKLLKR